MIVVSDTTPLMHSPKVSELTDGRDYWVSTIFGKEGYSYEKEYKN